MAIDLPVKRSSIICYSLPVGRTLPPVTSGINAAARAHLSRVYAGFSSVVPVFLPTNPLILMVANNTLTTLRMPEYGSTQDTLILTVSNNRQTIVRMPRSYFVG